MRRRGKKKLSELLAAGCAIMLLVSVGGYVFYQHINQRQYDEKTLCPKDGEYPRAAILIDATDKLSPSQQKEIGSRIKNGLLKDLDKSAKESDDRDWVGVFVLNEENLVLPSASFALCYPGGKDAANPLIESPREREEIMQKRFLDPLQTTLAKLVRQPPQGTSPILEMIKEVVNSTQPRRLVIISDMLQHVPEYSHYKGRADFEAFRQTDYARSFLELSLKGVDVKVYYLMREDTRGLQTNPHVDFWRDFFRHTGASGNTLIERI